MLLSKVTFNMCLQPWRYRPQIARIMPVKLQKTASGATFQKQDFYFFFLRFSVAKMQPEQLSFQSATEDVQGFWWCQWGARSTLVEPGQETVGIWMKVIQWIKPVKTEYCTWLLYNYKMNNYKDAKHQACLGMRRLAQFGIRARITQST